MVFHLEAGSLGNLDQGLIDRSFKIGRHREIADDPAARADQVMVMLGEFLGQFVASPFVGGDDALHYPGPLEHGQISIDRTAGQVGAMLKNFWDGEGIGRFAEQAHQLPPVRGVTLAIAPQSRGGDGIEFVADHRRMLPVHRPNRCRPPGLKEIVALNYENQYHFHVRLIVAAAIMLSLSGSACSAPGTTQTLPLVVTTTTQTADFARVLGGPSVRVYSVIRPGVDPHDYEPTAADLHAMTQAAVIVRNGLGLEPWFKQAETATTPRGIVVTASDGVNARAGDPHVWQNPRNAKIMVANITSALSRAVPSDSAAFASRSARYQAELDTLDTDIATDMSHLSDPKLVTNHDAFGYFIDRYGLDFVGSVLPSFDTSSELSPSDVRTLVAKITTQHVKAVFSEASLPPKTARAVAQEAGVRVIMGPDALYGDSLGPPGSEGDTYLKMMRHNARILMMALS